MRMIDRVARAISESHGTTGHTFEDDARAAISAMREPTDAMKKSVYDAENSMGVCYAAYEEINWETAWKVAIDAALKESVNG